MLLQFENSTVLWGLWGVFAWVIFLGALRLRRPESASWSRAILSTSVFTLCVLALARPQLGRQMMQKRALKGNLFIALDISKSMSAEDIIPSRIGFAVAFSTRLVQKLAGTKFALFPFSESGYLMMPLTSDTHVAEEMLAILNPSVTTNQSTNIGNSLEALFTTIQKMQTAAKERGEDWAPTQVLLLSDGESHVPVSPSILGYFRKERIPVFTVITGTKQGAQITVEEEGGSYRNPSSQRVLTKADPESMEKISRATGGDFFPPELAQADRAAQKISQAMAMGRLTATFKVEREFYPTLLLLALLCLTLDLLFGRWHSALKKTVVTATGLLIFSLPANAEVPPTNNALNNPERRAVDAYNQALPLMESSDIKKALELLQESATLTKDKTLKKKALFALGNAYLKSMEPQQAMQNYQAAHDVDAKNKSLETEANRRISENIALAVQLQEQMAQMAKDEQEKQQQQQGKGDKNGKEEDPKGPKRDYENQPFSEDEKKKMFDLMGTEDQGIQARLMQEKEKKQGKQSSGKPW